MERFDGPSCLHELIEARVREQPEAIAVVYEDASLTDIHQMAPGSSPTCNRFGSLASRDRRRFVGEQWWGVPKSSRTLKLPNLLSSRRRSPIVFDGTRDNRTPYAVDKTGGGRSSVISRKMSAKRVLGITTSAI
jgi:hypothetical protein